jgi:RNA polymerase sigma-54 factor
VSAKSKLKLSQRQRLSLSATMRQNLAILRMPTEMLVEDINREAAENPFLIMAPPPAGLSSYEVALATTSAPESRFELILREVSMQRLDPDVLAAARFLVSELREDGYLDTTLEEIAARTGGRIDILGQALEAVQRCDPPGIGARNLAECLALQLRDAGYERKLSDSIVQHLDAFAAQRWDELEDQIGARRSDLEDIAQLLPHLSAAPIRDDSGWSSVRIPELAVEVETDGSLSVGLVGEALPNISVMRLPKHPPLSDEARTYHDRARGLVAGITARRRTLLRIGAFIVEKQAAFFVSDVPSIRPVTRIEAAEALGLHPTTFGRAIAGKSLVANRRIHPLSRFFGQALPSGNGSVSAHDVQSRIRAMIDAETATSPLTDSDIHTRLLQEGVDIARRTVAKYRKCMRIPSSFTRRHRKAKNQRQPVAQRKI